MRTSRRNFMKMSAAGAVAGVSPSILRAQSAGGAGGTLRAVMLSDLRSFDPIWTTAAIANYHGGMIYDTLFGLDENMTPQPQMVSRYDVSDDRLTYTFELRDGLRFHDGSPVTSADCVASLRRWGARDVGGQALFARTADTPIVDDRTFKIVLKERFGLVLDTLGKVGTSVPYIMRKQDAETDPGTQVTNTIGSGPFTYNREESNQGASYVYDRNPDYVPRSEPANGTAGGKKVFLDRVIWQNMPDPQTAISALQAGEIDFYEMPPLDLIRLLETDPNINVEVLNETGFYGVGRMNHLQPPFNNPKARQAMLYLLNQIDILTATFGNPDYFNACGSMFGCGTPMENDANTDWFKGGQNLDKARQLFQEAGYSGEPVVILQPTDLPVLSNAALLCAQWMREIGVNAQLAASDWGGVVTRRTNQGPVEEGGWNLLFTWTSGANINSPVMYGGHGANGVEGMWGWPTSERHESLREEWAVADGHDARLAVARTMQEEGWDWVPQVTFGQWQQPQAWRSNVSGFLHVPELIPFWNVKKS